MRAVYNNDPRGVQIALSAGVSVDVAHRAGTPLILSVDVSAVDVIPVLLQAGADRSALHDEKTALWSVLHRAQIPDLSKKQKNTKVIAIGWRRGFLLATALNISSRPFPLRGRYAERAAEKEASAEERLRAARCLQILKDASKF